MSEALVKTYKDSQDLASGCAEQFCNVVKSYTEKSNKIYIALSGGNTPKQLFDMLATDYGDKINWKYVHFFWADERCLLPEDFASNYGMTKRHLLDKININPENVHRIKGEEDPAVEAARYSKEISEIVPMEKNQPRFDLTLLGIGSDGHTASIFPDHIEPLNLEEVCRVSQHPITGGKRITLTETAINNSKLIYFLVSGSDKAKVVSQVIRRYPEAGGYPAFHINPVDGNVTWFLDKDAAGFLN